MLANSDLLMGDPDACCLGPRYLLRCLFVRRPSPTERQNLMIRVVSSELETESESVIGFGSFLQWMIDIPEQQPEIRSDGQIGVLIALISAKLESAASINPEEPDFPRNHVNCAELELKVGFNAKVVHIPDCIDVVDEPVFVADVKGRDEKRESQIVWFWSVSCGKQWTDHQKSYHSDQTCHAGFFHLLSPLKTVYSLLMQNPYQPASLRSGLNLSPKKDN